MRVLSCLGLLFCLLIVPLSVSVHAATGEDAPTPPSPRRVSFADPPAVLIARSRSAPTLPSHGPVLKNGIPHVPPPSIMDHFKWYYVYNVACPLLFMIVGSVIGVWPTILCMPLIMGVQKVMQTLFEADGIGLKSIFAMDVPVAPKHACHETKNRAWTIHYSIVSMSAVLPAMGLDWLCWALTGVHPLTTWPIRFLVGLFTLMWWVWIDLVPKGHNMAREMAHHVPWMFFCMWLYREHVLSL